ncbi:MAG TPA: TetR family transcriptional regulator [Gammaproteobacteria bacterium]|nr:TetR family transcriptional regulator [Gammaproteobacteria bacterium]
MTASSSPSTTSSGNDKALKKARSTRERLVRCGIEVLTEQGFSSTGIDQILKRVGVPKGSFYHYFSSKDAFGQAVIEGYAEYFANKLDRHLLNVARDPLDRIHDFIADARAGMQRYAFRRGCLIGNLGQEFGGDERFADALEAVFIDWQGRIAVCLNEAKSQGHIPNSTDTEQLAEIFWMGWEGAILRAKLIRNVRPIDHFEAYFFASLAAGCTQLR